MNKLRENPGITHNKAFSNYVHRVQIQDTWELGLMQTGTGVPIS